jgi:hypothetical protein
VVDKDRSDKRAERYTGLFEQQTLRATGFRHFDAVHAAMKIDIFVLIRLS